MADSGMHGHRGGGRVAAVRILHEGLPFEPLVDYTCLPKRRDMGGLAGR